MFAAGMVARGEAEFRLQIIGTAALVLFAPIAAYLCYHGMVAVNSVGLLIRRPLRKDALLPWDALIIQPATLRITWNHGGRSQRVSLLKFFPMSSHIEDFLAQIVRQRDSLLGAAQAESSAGPTVPES